MERKTIPLTFLFLLLGVILVPTLVLGLNTVDTGYQLNRNSTLTITAQLNCRIVHNNSATLSFFVPTKTNTEWSYFRFLAPYPTINTEPCFGCNAYCPAGEGPLHSNCEDGCGGVCPPGCWSPLVCSPLTGTCEQPGSFCTPTHVCDLAYCGDNGCGATCGCKGAQVCINNACADACTPTHTCDGVYCGDDGCGMMCACNNVAEICSVHLCSVPFTEITCKSLLENDPGLLNQDGVYRINPDGNGEVEAYCDMTTDGGGWTLLFNLQTADDGIETWNATDFWLTIDRRGDTNDPWSRDYKSDAYSTLALDHKEMMVMVHNDGPRNQVFGKALYQSANGASGSLLTILNSGNNITLTGARSNLLDAKQAGKISDPQVYGDPFVQESQAIVLNDVRYGSGHGSPGGSSHNFVRFSTADGSADSHRTYGLGGSHDIECTCGHWGFDYEASVDASYCNVFRTGSNSHFQNYGGYTWCRGNTIEIDYAVFTR